MIKMLLVGLIQLYRYTLSPFLGRQPTFVLRADVFRVEVFRAGIEAAQVALATELGADHVGLADQVELQAPHGPMRLDRMAQQPARAKLRAKAALVARATADADDLVPVLPAAADQVCPLKDADVF